MPLGIVVGADHVKQSCRTSPDATDPKTRTMSSRRPADTIPAAWSEAGDPRSDRKMTIGELARTLGLTTRTIRFYEAKGLIAPDRRGVARSYGHRDIVRMKIILRGKNLGFSLEEIAEYLTLYDADPSQITQTEMLLGKVRVHIELLQKQRADLDRTLRELKDIRGMCESHLKAAAKS